MKIIVGAGGKTQDGWRATEQSELDLLHEVDFVRMLNGALGFEAILVEHCVEHLTIDEIPVALANCFKYLSPNGRLRIAVPDGLHPNPDYIEHVSPPNDGHKILLNYRLLSRLMRQAGFEVNLLEWWNEDGGFRANPWYSMDGDIERCLTNDPRNDDGWPHYTSLILDGIKVTDKTRPHLDKAFEFISNTDINGLSGFNRKKAYAFYELARLTPAGGVIIEIGCYLGMGTVPLWYGARDGHRCTVYAVDPYVEFFGWIGERYGPEDQKVWESNMAKEKVHPKLVKGYSHELSQVWKEPVSLAIFDIPTRNTYLEAARDWEKHVVVGGLIGLRDIDDYSMGTEEAIEYLLGTGRWGNRKYWEAFITSMERIA